MKILKGAYKGVELTVPENGPVRPTVDHFKKNIFQYLEEHQIKIDSTTSVWDLFAGCGGVGLEFFSRGAGEVIWVEQTKQAIQALKLNLAECALADPQTYAKQKALPLVAETLKFLSDPASFGVNHSPTVVFLDPPYGDNWISQTIPALARCSLITPHTLIIAEHVSEDIATPSGRIQIQDSISYGPKMMTILKPSE